MHKGTLMTIKRVFFSTLVFLLFSASHGWAQCAMCRAAVENNVSENSAGLSVGLNTGILYLFVAPYLLVMIIGYLWYKKSKVHARKIQVPGDFKG